MRKQLGGIGIAIVMLAAGCGASPPPAAKSPPGPPAPPPVVAAPAPAPVAPPEAKPAPPMLPPELIAKMDELLKIAKPPAAGGADALDQAVGAIEQQAKVGALAGEIVALVGKLSPEQQTEFSRRYGEQFAAIQKPALPPPATP